MDQFVVTWPEIVVIGTLWLLGSIAGLGFAVWRMEVNTQTMHEVIVLARQTCAMMTEPNKRASQHVMHVSPQELGQALALLRQNRQVAVKKRKCTEDAPIITCQFVDFVDEPLDESPNEPLDEPPDEPLDEPPDEPLDESPNESLDESPNESLDESPNESLDEPPDELLDEPPDELLDVAADEQLDVAADFDPEGDRDTIEIRTPNLEVLKCLEIGE